jgi:hypothetical protein
MLSAPTIGAALKPGYRPVRVTVLLCGVVLLSLADLYMTLVHLMSFGMIEANPLARGIMAYGSPAALIVWKLVTVTTAVGILFYARRRRAAEVGAIFCCCVLLWLTGRWIAYNAQVGHWTGEMHSLAGVNAPDWVSMSDR